MVRVVLITDRSELAEWLIPEFRAAGLAVSLPTPKRSRAAVEEAMTVCVADRGATDDRGVSLLRATRAAGLDIPFVFIDPTHAAPSPPPWEGRGVHRIEPYDVGALMECVRGCARRLVNAASELLDRESLRFGDLVLDCGRLDAFVGEDKAGLTPAQFAFLYHLAQDASRYHSSGELTQALWGRRHVPGEKNIAYVVSQIRRKVIALNPALQVIDSKRGIGYRFITPPTGEVESVAGNASSPIDGGVR
jgi:DNA-binding response OmpR family regulator